MLQDGALSSCGQPRFSFYDITCVLAPPRSWNTGSADSSDLTVVGLGRTASVSLHKLLPVLASSLKSDIPSYMCSDQILSRSALVGRCKSPGQIREKEELRTGSSNARPAIWERRQNGRVSYEWSKFLIPFCWKADPFLMCRSSSRFPLKAWKPRKPCPCQDLLLPKCKHEQNCCWPTSKAHCCVAAAVYDQGICEIGCTLPIEAGFEAGKEIALYIACTLFHSDLDIGASTLIWTLGHQLDDVGWMTWLCTRYPAFLEKQVSVSNLQGINSWRVYLSQFLKLNGKHCTS